MEHNQKTNLISNEANSVNFPNLSNRVRPDGFHTPRPTFREQTLGELWKRQGQELASTHTTLLVEKWAELSKSKVMDL